MGVDASFFAVKAKKYYYFDREYNVVVSELIWENVCSPKYEEVVVDLTRYKNCNYDNAAWLLNQNILYWNQHPEEDQRCRATCNESLLKFIHMFPDDTFFIATDHEDPSYWDVAKTDGYTEFQFPEDIPEPPRCHCPQAWCPLHITANEIQFQTETIKELQKVLSIGGSLVVDDGHLELANLNGTSKKIKL